MEPERPRSARHPESDTTCFALNRHRMIPEIRSIHFVKQVKNLQMDDRDADWASVLIRLQVEYFVVVASFDWPMCYCFGK